MTENKAQCDPAMERIVGAIDRDMSIPLSVQLKGALEFGIGSGALAVGTRLPSVRRLAGRIGISPVTISQVYASLQAAGHIEGRVGCGTFVSGTVPVASAARLRDLEAQIAALVATGRECGLSRGELAMRVSMSRPASCHPVRMLMIGNFQEATESYAADIRPHLRRGDRIAATTLSRIATEPPGDFDLVLAPKTILGAVREAFPDTDMLGLTLIPNEATRVALASIQPEAVTVAFSYYAGFVPVMKAGVMRFAPHVTRLRMAVRGDARADALIADAAVLIYASGAEYLCDRLRGDQTAFEYRHTPDSQAIRTELLPAIEACRTQDKLTKEAAT